MARILARHQRIIAVASRDVRMVFNRDKGFFLTLDQNAETVKLAIPESPAASETAPSENAASETETSESVTSESVASETVTVEAATAEVATAEVATAMASPAEAASTASVATPAAASSAQPVMTTAEAIAAELAAAEASRPPVSMTTFAPDNLMAGSGLLMKKRRPGAAMKGFRSIASELFKS